MIVIEENTLIHVDSSSDVIEHYGVKGMKWGVRKAKETYSKVSRKVADRRTDSLRYKYYKKGMSIADADAKARKRVKLEGKAVKVAGAAALAYGAYRIGKNIQRDHFGENLKGKKLQTVTLGDLDTSKDFFVAKGGDNVRYKKIWGAHLEGNKLWYPGGPSKKTGVNSLKFKGDAKVAPTKEVLKSLRKAVKKDRTALEDVDANILNKAMWGDQTINGVLARNDIRKGKITKRVLKEAVKSYRGNQELMDKIGKDLKKKGYAGMYDYNDLDRRTVVRARKDPVILFSGKKNMSKKTSYNLDLNTK